MGSTVPDTDFGRRLIPTLIDEFACSKPNKTYCFVARSSAVEDGFESISYSQFANAINRCSYWMDTQLGRGQNFNTVAYLGPSDCLLTIIIIVAAIKTGHKALLTSPRNSLQAHLNLLESTQCRILLTPAVIPPVAESILFQRQMRHVIMPGVEQWLLDEHVVPYPYERTFAGARFEPFVVVHTSGSTGLPKPVIVTHGTVATSDALNKLASNSERDPVFSEAFRNRFCFISLPPFHIAGIAFILSFPIYYGIVPVLAPSSIPMTAELVDFMHRLDIVECSVVAPSILQEISQTPSFLKNLERLSSVSYGGGPLAKGAGNIIRSFTNVYNLMGSSEMYSIATELAGQEDWDYLKFSPMMGIVFNHHSEDLWELSFVRNPAFDLYQGIFATYPEMQEYHTSDLYSKHATKPDLWLYQGRADDIIALSNGEKFNPVAMEGLIGAHPDVKSVLVAGQGRFQPALLVEANNRLVSDDDRERMKEAIWPIVSQANSDCVAHGRLSKDLIIFTDSAKPFQRAGKGTVQRRLTLDTFEHEIEELYDTVNHQTTSNENATMKPLVGPLHPCLRDLILSIANWKILGYGDDFFALGMDSLQVINLVRQINCLSIDMNGTSKTPHITAKVVYSNPTVDKLATAVTRETISHAENGINGHSASDENLAEMQSLLLEYSRGLPTMQKPLDILKNDHRPCVLLTGSTGSIGSYVLDVLFHNQRVRKICCLNRSSTGEARQRKSQSLKGLSTVWTPDRVTFLQSDLSAPNLGLSPQNYSELLANTTHVLINAWPVDFNQPITFFIPQFHGLRQYIDFCTCSPNQPPILFLSSISAAMNSLSPVPERILTDFASPAPMGYAQSKYLAERLLDTAHQTSGVRSSICRVGQVAGPVMAKHVRAGGMWNKQEWLPSLIASSKYLRKIPATLGPNEVVDWIPVDVLSRVLVELLLREEKTVSGMPDQANEKLGAQSPTAVFHALNPHSTTWRALLPTILSSWHGPSPPEIVPLHAWVASLRTSAAANSDVSANPALKLLDFFERLAAAEEEEEAGVRFETTKTVQASTALAGLEAVSGEWMEGWMRQWGF